MLERLKLIGKIFTPLEEEILSEVAKLLPPAAKEKFLKQVKSINKVQRLLDWTEINFYSIKSGKVHWDIENRFKNEDEIRLAEIKFTLKERPFQSTLIAVSGHIFSLITRPSAKFYARSKIDLVNKAVLLNDPEEIGINATAPYSLPASYLSWTKDRSAYEKNGWLILGQGEVYSVSLKDKDYIVLAERGGEFLLAEDKKNTIYYAYHDNDKIIPLGEDFNQIIDNKINYEQ